MNRHSHSLIDPLRPAGSGRPRAAGQTGVPLAQAPSAAAPLNAAGMPLPQDRVEVSREARNALQRDAQAVQAKANEALQEAQAEGQEDKQRRIVELTCRLNEALAIGDEAKAGDLMREIIDLAGEDGSFAHGPQAPGAPPCGNIPRFSGDAPVFFPGYVAGGGPRRPMSPADVAGVQAALPGDGHQGVVNSSLGIASQGLPYVWGGDGPREGGYDCSGFSKAVYAKNGVNIPRTVQPQYDYCRRQGTLFTDAGSAKPGDLIFFDNPYGKKNTPVGHVMVYLGNGKMVGAQSGGVKVYHYNSYWRKYTVGFGRPH